MFLCVVFSFTNNRTRFHSRLCKTETTVILEKNMHNTATAVIEKACQHITCTSFCKIIMQYILLSVFNDVGTTSFTSMASEPKQNSLFSFVCLQLKSISPLQVDLVVIVKIYD